MFTRVSAPFAVGIRERCLFEFGVILKLEATKNFFFLFISKHFFLYEILMQLTEVSFDCHNLFLKAGFH